MILGLASNFYRRRRQGGGMMADDRPSPRRLAVDESVSGRKLYLLFTLPEAESVKAIGDRGIAKEIDLLRLHRRL
jgi:hypothetical protein